MTTEKKEEEIVGEFLVSLIETAFNAGWQSSVECLRLYGTSLTTEIATHYRLQSRQAHLATVLDIISKHTTGNDTL